MILANIVTLHLLFQLTIINNNNEKRRMKNEKKKYTMSDSRRQTCCAVRAGKAGQSGLLPRQGCPVTEAEQNHYSGARKILLRRGAKRGVFRRLTQQHSGYDSVTFRLRPSNTPATPPKVPAHPCLMHKATMHDVQGWRQLLSHICLCFKEFIVILHHISSNLYSICLGLSSTYYLS